MLTIDMLKAQGISTDYGHLTRIMPYHEENGKIVLDPVAGRQLAQDCARFHRTMAQDAALTTAANTSFPVFYFTYLDPRIVEVLFGALNAARFMAPTKYGSWTDEQAQFAVEEMTGDVTPYADFADNGVTDVNYNFPVRQHFRYQTTLRYGDLETEKAGEAKLSLVARKQNATAQIMARAENKFQLYGVAGKQIYGMLNDPNLNATISPNAIPKTGSTSSETLSTWEDKCGQDPDKAANYVFNDINDLIVELSEKNEGNFDQQARIILGISPGRFPYLTLPNQYGKTAAQLLKENYPNIEIVQLPELSTDGGEMLYMIVPEVLGDETGFTAFSEKYRLSRMVPHATSFEQKAFAGTWGCVIRRPSFIARMLGI